MESKERFMEIINKLGKEHFQYLDKLFAGCPEDVIKKMRYLEIPSKYNLIYAGAPCESVYVILKGKVSCVDFQLRGNTYVIMDYAETAILGDYEVFGDFKEYRASVYSVTACELLKIPASAYLYWMQQDANALFMRTRKLMNILTNQTSDDRQYLFLGSKDRLILYLVKSYEKNAKGNGFVMRKTQSEIAERVGFHVRTIQRNVRSLEKEEFITIDAGKICISKEQYLMMKQYVENHLNK